MIVLRIHANNGTVILTEGPLAPLGACVEIQVLSDFTRKNMRSGALVHPELAQNKVHRFADELRSLLERNGVECQKEVLT